MTIKQYVLDALGKFWTKLKSTYVTNCASTSNNLALAASQGKVLQDQITALNSRSAIVNWRAYSDIGTAMQTEFANYADGAYNIQAILSGGAMYEIVASVRQGSGSVFWSLGTYTVSGKVYSFDVTNTGIAIKDYQGQIDELNSKIAYENFSTQIAFESGAPSSYVGYADISIGKTGYTPISVSLRSVPGAAGLNVYSLQFAITTGTARIAYGRNGAGAAYSNTVGISVVYIKTS